MIERFDRTPRRYQRWCSESEGWILPDAPAELRARSRVLASELARYLDADADADADEDDFRSHLEGDGPGAYVGQRDPEARAVVLRPRWPCAIIPPTGFEWGCHGSGPSQLALALRIDVTAGDVATAERHYQRFNRERVATWRRQGMGDGHRGAARLAGRRGGGRVPEVLRRLTDEGVLPLDARRRLIEAARFSPGVSRAHRAARPPHPRAGGGRALSRRGAYGPRLAADQASESARWSAPSRSFRLRPDAPKAPEPYP